MAGEFISEVQLTELRRRLAALERAVRWFSHPLTSLRPDYGRVAVGSDRTISLRTSDTPITEVHSVVLDIPGPFTFEPDAIVGFSGAGEPVGLILIAPAHGRLRSLDRNDRLMMSIFGRFPFDERADFDRGPETTIATLFPGARAELLRQFEGVWAGYDGRRPDSAIQAWYREPPPNEGLTIDVRLNPKQVERLRRDRWPELLTTCRAQTTTLFAAIADSVEKRWDLDGDSLKSTLTSATGHEPKRVSGNPAADPSPRDLILASLAQLIENELDEIELEPAIWDSDAFLHRLRRSGYSKLVVEIGKQTMVRMPACGHSPSELRSQLMLRAGQVDDSAFISTHYQVKKLHNEVQAAQFGAPLVDILVPAIGDADTSAVNNWRDFGYEAICREAQWATREAIGALERTAPTLLAIFDNERFLSHFDATSVRREWAPIRASVEGLHESISRNLAARLKLMAESTTRRQSIEMDIRDGASGQRVVDLWERAQTSATRAHQAAASHVEHLRTLVASTETWLRSLSVEDLAVLAYQEQVVGVRIGMCMSVGVRRQMDTNTLLGTWLSPEMRADAPSPQMDKAVSDQCIAVGAVALYERSKGLKPGALFDLDTTAGQNFQLWVATCETDPLAERRFLHGSHPDEAFVVDRVLEARQSGRDLVPDLGETETVIENLGAVL